jgi:hydroxymethylbilane synthase
LPETFRIGTRGSLLALTQTNQVKKQLEELTGHQFELEIIKTQGDVQTGAPLWQLSGQNFFTKELDEALLEKKVDFVVHSYKDLGSLRPEGIMIGAITERTYPHDILLVPRKVISDLQEGRVKEFKVGTSSPRRMANMENSLKDYLPSGNPDLTVKTETLRGNVNTRIQKLKDGNYHAIVLALAGIERLALTPESCKTLQELVEGLSFMVLPKTTFPGAAAQGALALECLENSRALEVIKLLDHPITREEIKRERKSFNDYGGGCHLAVGIAVKKLEGAFLHLHQGELDGKRVNVHQIETTQADRPKVNSKTSFIGLPPSKLGEQDCPVMGDFLLKKTPLKREEVNQNSFQQGHFFVSSSYCLDALPENRDTKLALWSSGTKTHKALAKKGFWVWGSSDGLGENEIDLLHRSKALSLFFKDSPLGNWTILTHKDSKNRKGKVLPCYARETLSFDPQLEEDLKAVDLFYWTSFYQYETYLKHFPFIKNKTHCSGLGKTWEQFQENKIEVYPFSGLEEFKDWAISQNEAPEKSV